MLTYATTDDLQTWIGAAVPTDADQLLRTASMAVRDATMTNYYPVDGTGLPTDAKTLQAFKDATCAHAAALSDAKVSATAGGVLAANVATSKKVGSASIDYAGAGAATQAKQALLAGLCPEGVQILRQAGIACAAPWTTS